MATLATNEIETQFAHMSATEQLALIERLVHQVRSGAVMNGHVHDGEATAETTGQRFRREWDSVNVDFRASESDLLSEA